MTALALWSAASLLPACGASGRIAGTWSNWCPVNKRQALEGRLAALTASNSDLERVILQRERELALLQCEPEVPPVTPPASSVPEPPPQIDSEAWDDRRIDLLDGCWELESRFVTTNRQTGEESRYSEWTMCFDASGLGHEEMRADNGNSCSGPVEGRFDDAGNLVIEEPGNLPCSDGGFIYRLRSTCRLQDDGTASCVVRQPELGGSTTVDFRRSTRGK